MQRDNGLLARLCLLLLVILAGTVLTYAILLLGGAFLAFPIPAAMALILECAIPTAIVALYLNRTLKARKEGEGATQRTYAAASPSQLHGQEEPAGLEVKHRLESAMEADSLTAHVRPQTLVPPRAAQTEAEKGKDSVESLQARIDELEERVRWLRERLAAGFTADATLAEQPRANGKPLQTRAAEGTEELSERALQQLLEALDEKLAKGAIPQQLYQRLRDKYLARLSRARGKREAASKAVSGKPRRRR